MDPLGVAFRDGDEAALTTVMDRHRRELHVVGAGDGQAAAADDGRGEVGRVAAGVLEKDAFGAERKTADAVAQRVGRRAGPGRYDGSGRDRQRPGRQKLGQRVRRSVGDNQGADRLVGQCRDGRGHAGDDLDDVARATEEGAEGARGRSF